MGTRDRPKGPKFAGVKFISRFAGLGVYILLVWENSEIWFGSIFAVGRRGGLPLPGRAYGLDSTVSDSTVGDSVGMVPLRKNVGWDCLDPLMSFSVEAAIEILVSLFFRVEFRLFTPFSSYWSLTLIFLDSLSSTLNMSSRSLVSIEDRDLSF